MTELVARPTSNNGLHTLTRAAVEATGSAAGWLLHRNAAGFAIVCEAGAVSLNSGSRPFQGAAGMVFSSGQPAALLPGSDEAANRGAAGLDGVPGALLAVPCASTGVIGVLELGRIDTENYGIDELELAVLLGEIAGTMLEELMPTDNSAPSAEIVLSQLADVSRSEPARYRDVVRTIGWMLQ